MAAALLSRAGLDVTVIDRQATCRPDFRAEQLVGPQTDALRSLGLLDGIVRQTVPVAGATARSHGKIIDANCHVHYGLRYEDMVNAAREMAPGARFITGRVTRIAPAPDEQVVSLADGGSVRTRLVVVATGLNNDGLLRPLGIERLTLSANHSLTFGFDVETSSRGIVTCYGERPGDGIDYLTVFPIGAVMRANLFCYREPDDEWAKSFRLRPKQALLEIMPSLEHGLGAFEVTGKVMARFNSIRRAENMRQPGIVLIGDAYQSSCPAVGSGVGRILSDVATLARLAPDWMATPGMGLDKIQAFYAEPGKCRVDAKAIRDACHRRELFLNAGWQWQARRALHLHGRRARQWFRETIQGLRPATDGAGSAMDPATMMPTLDHTLPVP